MSNGRHCHYCNKTFYSTSNRARHEKAMHGGSTIGAGDPSDGEEEEEEEEEEEPFEWKHWRKLIKQTIKQMDTKTPSDTNYLLQEPHLSNFLDKMRERMEKCMEFCRYMKNVDPIYKKIQNTSNKYKKNHGLEEGEAFEKAWNDRSFLLKRFLRDHSEEIDDLLPEDSDYEEEDEQMEEPEAEGYESEDEMESNYNDDDKLGESGRNSDEESIPEKSDYDDDEFPSDDEILQLEQNDPDMFRLIQKSAKQPLMFHP